MARRSHTFVEPTPVGPSAQANPAQKEPRGVLITFEGGEGAGKSTHIGRLASLLEEHGEKVVRLREPGGTAIGEALRGVVLDVHNSQMADECELLIYEAARAQIVKEVIAPALEEGAVVLCDRFYDSTIAYQAYGRGLSREFVSVCNEFACQGVRPDRTILMTTGGSAQTGLDRATQRLGADRLEMAGTDFHTRVNQAFEDLYQQDPQRIRKVVSDGSKDVTAAKILRELVDLFPWMEEVLAKRHVQGAEGKA